MSHRGLARGRSSPSLAERFHAQYIPEPNSGCWLWTGTCDGLGRYGQIYRDGKYVRAHRLSWEFANGRPVPKGLQVHHRCDVPSCVNPDHLWVGTQSQNMEDMVKKGRNPRRNRKSHCINGHKFTDENTYMTPNGYRHCVSCKRAAWRRFTDKREVLKNGV